MVYDKCEVFSHKCKDANFLHIALTDILESNNRAPATAVKEGEWIHVQGRNARRASKGNEANESANVATSDSSMTKTPSNVLAGVLNT